MSTGAELLRASGLRVTRQRLAVLDILTEGGHLEVEEITQRVRVRLDSVSTQAVYDVLGALSRAGLARRIEPAGSPARYEARAGDNHHHLVCRLLLEKKKQQQVQEKHRNQRKATIRPKAHGIVLRPRGS